jgi:hypothetical protein
MSPVEEDQYMTQIERLEYYMMDNYTVEGMDKTLQVISI